MDAPWLSVVVPTYNGEPFLRQMLASIAIQSEKNIEIIVVDDGSIDRTQEILNSVKSELPISLISNPHRGNWIASTNEALDLARGEFVTFLHQDDFWLPGRLSQMKALAEEFPSAKVLLHDARFVDEDGTILGAWHCPFKRQRQLLEKNEVFRKLIVQNFIAIPSPIFSRSLVSRVGLLDTSLWFTADWKLWLSLALAADWAYEPSILAAFRIHSNSQTVTGIKKASSYKEQYEQVLDEFLPHIANDPGLIQIARFSAEFNCFLAAAFHRRNLGFARLFWNALRLGPTGVCRYLTYSRILERVLARLRVRLRRPVLTNGTA